MYYWMNYQWNEFPVMYKQYTWGWVLKQLVFPENHHYLHTMTLKTYCRESFSSSSSSVLASNNCVLSFRLFMILWHFFLYWKHKKRTVKNRMNIYCGQSTEIQHVEGDRMAFSCKLPPASIFLCLKGINIRKQRAKFGNWVQESLPTTVLQNANLTRLSNLL